MHIKWRDMLTLPGDRNTVLRARKIQTQLKGVQRGRGGKVRRRCRAIAGRGAHARRVSQFMLKVSPHGIVALCVVYCVCEEEQKVLIKAWSWSTCNTSARWHCYYHNYYFSFLPSFLPSATVLKIALAVWTSSNYLQASNLNVETGKVL